jgi:predicted DNA-binding ribbon-helix-helix protein
MNNPPMNNPPEAVNKRSVVLAGHRTSISLEAEFWRALRAVARARRLSVNALVAAIDAGREPGRPANLSSALRVFILDCYRTGELLPESSPPAAQYGERSREMGS